MGPRIVIYAIAALCGVLLAVGVYRSYSRHDRRKTTLVITALIAGGIMFVLGFPAHAIAHSTVKAAKVGGYHQTLNGSLTRAVRERHNCYKVEQSYSSGCSHNSSCDPYTYTWTETYTDTKGNTKWRQRSETRWHVCPDGTVEFSYFLYDNFGKRYTIASHIYGADTRPAYGRLGNVPRGVPQQWELARVAIANNNAPPVTIDDEYTNYILGSEAKLLRSYSSDIASLKLRNLLPAYPARIHGYQADKVMFVGGTRPIDPVIRATWQDRLMRFNAALGMQRQGDLYIVAVDITALPSEIDSADYVRALKAYWQGSFGKKSLAKNAIVVALGVDSSTSTLKWARAETGMPGGNGEMLELLQLRLEGQKFDSGVILGDTTAGIDWSGKKWKPFYTVGSGVIPQVVMTDKPFIRACMGCEGKEDKGQLGYVNLQDLIPLSWGATIVTCLILFAISLVLYGFMLWAYSGWWGIPNIWQYDYAFRP